MDARISQTPIPFEAARAYGLRPASRPSPDAKPADAPARTDMADRVDLSAASPRPEKINSLIAARVDVRVDFTPATSSRPAADGPLQLYRHPADKNAAATGVDAGRTIDVRG